MDVLIISTDLQYYAASALYIYSHVYMHICEYTVNMEAKMRLGAKISLRN